MVEVKSTTFKVFYDVLCEKIIEREYPRLKKDRPASYTLVWDIFEDKVPYPFSVHRATSYEYFKIKMAELDPEYSRKGSIIHGALFKALSYVGIKESYVDPNDFENYKGAMALLKAFEQKYRKEIRKLDVHYPGVVETIMQDGYAITKDTHVLKTGAHDLIPDLFSHLKHGHFDRAWNLFTSSYREKYSLSTFTLYFSQIKIKAINILDDAEIREPESKVIVLLRYDLHTYVVPGQNEVMKLNLMETDRIQPEIEKLKKQFEFVNEQVFKTIPLEELFRPDFYKYVYVTSSANGAPLKDLNSFFESSQIIPRHRVFYFDCILDREQWFITTVRSLDGL